MAKAKLGTAFYKFCKSVGIKEVPLCTPPARRKVNQGSIPGQKKPVNWVHSVYGEVLNASSSELVKLFPDQKLNSANLSRVSLGKQITHKGWRVLTDNVPKSVIIFNPDTVQKKKENNVDSYSSDLIERGA